MCPTRNPFHRKFVEPEMTHFRTGSACGGQVGGDALRPVQVARHALENAHRLLILVSTRVLKLVSNHAVFRRVPTPALFRSHVLTLVHQKRFLLVHW